MSDLLFCWGGGRGGVGGEGEGIMAMMEKMMEGQSKRNSHAAQRTKMKLT